MSIAEKIVSGEQKPTKALEDKAAEVEARALEVLAGVESPEGRREILNRVHWEEVQKLSRRVDDEGDAAPERAKIAAAALEAGTINEATAANVSGVSRADARDARDAFIADVIENGTYAYALMSMTDGSFVGVYVEKAGQKAKFVAFFEFDETIGWHPTRAPLKD